MDVLSGEVVVSLQLLLFLLRPDATRDTTGELVLSLLFLLTIEDLTETLEGTEEVSTFLPLLFRLRTGLVIEGRGGKAGRSEGFFFRDGTRAGFSRLELVLLSLSASFSLCSL